LNRSMIYSL